MKKLSLAISVTLALVLLAAALFTGGCGSKEEQGKPSATATPATKADPGAPARTDTAAPAAPAGQTTPAAGGNKYSPYAECDAAMTKLEECMGKLAADNIQRQAYENMKEVVKDVPADAPEAARKPVVDSCVNYYNSIKGQSEAICPGVKLQDL
jgi:hypothetical protein